MSAAQTDDGETQNDQRQWVYDRERDVWTLDGPGIAIEGAVIRQLTRQVLRTRRSRALAELESRFSAHQVDAPDYGKAVVDLLGGSWASRLAS